MLYITLIFSGVLAAMTPENTYVVQQILNIQCGAVKTWSIFSKILTKDTA